MILNATAIIESADIVSVISKFVDLKRSGTNYTANSPFNAKDKTPSFVVSPRKGIYKCFSTGHGGDAVSFLMEYKHWTFVEAVEYLAQESSHIIEYSQGANREQEIARERENKEIRTSLYEVMKKAHDSYIAVVATPENESDTITIAGKSYTQTTLDRWSIKTAGDWNHLSHISKSWTEAERSALIDLGLIRANKKGDGFFDFFHHRLLFPLVDDRGRMVGYNARVMEGYPEPKDGKPSKYINSGDSLIFNKSKFLFGYYQNQEEISRLNLALLVEGPTDVIMLDQAGIGYAVCSSGTGFTIDQARILAKSADTVIICFDADKAGHDATIRAITTLLRAQLEVKVKVLPEESDPASFVTLMGADAFRALPSVDAIEFALTANFPNLKDATPTTRSAAVLLVSTLISEISDENIREAYCQTLYKSLDVTRKVLSDLVKEKVEEKTDGTSKLTPEQERQKMTYGVYIDNNRYHDHNGYEISNFVVRPLFLVSYNGAANRIFEIINKYGNTKIININSDDFITLMGFRRATEMLGSFIFKGNDAQYIKIREWIYTEMKEVYPIEVLGYQPRHGIYAWSNGITLPGSVSVQEVDEYGIVEFKSESMDKPMNFFLPAESKINIKHDEDNDRELETNFKYILPPSGSGAPRSLSEWSAGFARVFGKNAAVALCWIMASVHRDMLHARYDMYPHLNLFGPAGSGKTFMAQIITAIFGKPMRAVHLVSSSPVAFYRRIAQTRNSIIWYEEYSEKVSPDKQEALKNFADGFGRVTGQMTNNNKTKSTPVLNACIISGQILPSHDPALLERCITLFFDKFYGDKNATKYAEQFKSWSNAGIFAYVACEIHSMREYIQERFVDVMEEIRDQIRAMFVPTTMPSDRVLNNFAMVATCYIIIAQKVKLPFSTSQILDVIVERIQDQSRAVEGADELSGFWMVIEFLITKGKEVNGQGIGPDHYAVEYHKSITIKVNEAETKTVEFDAENKLMFLRLNHAHSLYVREGKNMVSRVVEKGTLLHYMKQHRSYVGEMKAKRINDKPQRCYVFNLEHLPQFEFECTNFAVKEKESTKEFVNTEYDVNNGMNTTLKATDGEIPF